MRFVLLSTFAWLACCATSYGQCPGGQCSRAAVTLYSTPTYAAPVHYPALAPVAVSHPVNCACPVCVCQGCQCGTYATAPTVRYYRTSPVYYRTARPVYYGTYCGPNGCSLR